MRSARIVPTSRLILNGTCARPAATVPPLHGPGVLDQLRARMRTAALPVIVLTAQSGEREEKALDLGAQDYLTKPAEARPLVARVRAVLERINT